MRYFEKERKEATPRFLDELPNEFHQVILEGVQLAVFPNVFSPKYFLDPAYFASHVPIKKGESFLEVGCGSGIMSVFAALRGARVVATDCNPYAVLNTQYNALANNLNIRVVQGDVFQGIQGTFDTIYSNPPWGCIKEKPTTWMQRALWDTEYAMTKRLIRESRQHLNKDGRLVIGFSSTTGDLDFLLQELANAGYTSRIIDRCVSKSIDYPATFEIIEAKVQRTQDPRRTNI